MVLLGHLVEFVDAADALIAEHQRASLDGELARALFSRQRHCETGARRIGATNVHASRRDLRHGSEHLRLAEAWVADNEEVWVATDRHAVLLVRVPRRATKQRHGKTGLDELVSVDRRADRVHHETERVLVVEDHADEAKVLGRQQRLDLLAHALLVVLDRVGIEVERVHGAVGVDAIALGTTGAGALDRADDRDDVTGRARVDQRASDLAFQRSRHTARVGRSVAHQFLYSARKAISHMCDGHRRRVESR